MRGSRSVDSEREQDAVSRRRFLTVVGAGATLTGLAACTRGPRRHIVPYVVQPPEERPGVARHYATAMSIDGYGMGLVVEAHEGRPTKIEGNPEHPASLGATGVLQQAAILDLTIAAALARSSTAATSPGGRRSSRRWARRRRRERSSTS